MRMLLLSLLIVAGCCSGSKMVDSKKKNGFIPDFATGPPTMVYKTKADYSQHVPVILSDDKTVILSYPAPTDIKAGDKYPSPTPLKDGYLLDNRGINANVAYLNLTYKEYAKLATAPDIKTMNTMIMDKDPLTEMCNCGSKQAFKNPEKEINTLIKTGKLRTVCKALK
jgi:hypothetical protein